MTTPTPTGPEDGARAERLAESIKVAFAAFGQAEMPAEDRPRWHQRLIAITNSSKHDIATAEGRLEKYWSDWEAEVGPRPDGT